MDSDRMIQRGVEQALYKYLPESWIDFPVRGPGRRQYIAKVVRWSSKKLDGINRKRLIRMVNHAVHSFGVGGQTGGEKYIPPTSGFGAELLPENCDVLTPKVSDEERGVIAKISPLTFYCPKCSKVFQFDNKPLYHYQVKCDECHVELKQFRQIYFCKCGYATDKHKVRCDKHGSSSIYWDGAYELTCRKCQRKFQMTTACPECGQKLGAKPALDPSQFFAFSLSMIDLIDERLEQFIADTDYGKYIALAYWLGRISRDDLETIVERGITNSEQYNKEFEKQYLMFKQAGTNEETARTYAKMVADSICGNPSANIIDRIKTEVFSSPEDFEAFSEMILEFQMVKELKGNTTLDKAIQAAKTLNTNANPESFRNVAAQLGITNAQACDSIPFVTCSYGYTRAKPEYEPGVQLHAFKEEEKGRKNIYAVRLNTEGVLFEFDRKEILSWLSKNCIIDPLPASDLESEEKVKLWYANHIHIRDITPFTPLDESLSPETYYIYRLIHSISHLLIRAAADIGGLGKDSLSEYIFPGIPAVLIYVQNSQGFSLGSLLNTFEAYFDKWMKRANFMAQKCVFDPICIERQKACTGCLYLNEISCQHFNRDLDRSLVVGYVDKQTKKRTFGFWEDT